jgi:hypothetical protein
MLDRDQTPYGVMLLMSGSNGLLSDGTGNDWQGEASRTAQDAAADGETPRG